MISKEMLIHIGAEIIIVGGIAFYFYTKNKKLSERITELEHVVKNFQDQSVKQQKQINLINKKLGNFKSTQIYNIDSLPQSKAETNKPTVKKVQVHVTGVSSPKLEQKNNTPRVTEVFESEEESEDDSFDEEDLDNELEEELKDLEELKLSDDLD